MFNHPLVIGIIMAVLASIPLYLLSLGGYQLQLVHLPVFLVSLLVFFIGTAVWSARGVQTSGGRSSTPRYRSRSRSSAPPPSGNVQPRGPRETGTVKWFNVNKGFGFISREDGSDIFVHFRSIRGYGHRVLEEGQQVEFGVVMGEKGDQAHDVEILG